MDEKQHTVDRDGLAKCSGERVPFGSRRFGQDGVPDGSDATPEIRACPTCVSLNLAFIRQHDAEYTGGGPFRHEYLYGVPGTSGAHLSADVGPSAEPDAGLDGVAAGEVRAATGLLDHVLRRVRPKGS